MKTEKLYKGIVKHDSSIKNLNISKHTRLFLERQVGKELGLVKGGKETLLYEVNNTQYKDIFNNIKYSNKDVIDGLVPYSRMIKSKKHISKRKAKKNYYEKLYEELDIKNLYVGDICFISNFKKEISAKNGKRNIDINLNCIPVKKNALLLLDEDKYIDLETYIKYSKNKLGLGCSMIVDPKFFGEVLSEQELEEKMTTAKVLSKYREKYGLNNYK